MRAPPCPHAFGYMPLHGAQGITGSQLLALSDDALAAQHGVSDPGQRRQLLAARQRLAQGASPAAKPLLPPAQTGSQHSSPAKGGGVRFHSSVGGGGGSSSPGDGAQLIAARQQGASSSAGGGGSSSGVESPRVRSSGGGSSVAGWGSPEPSGRSRCALIRGNGTGSAPRFTALTQIAQRDWHELGDGPGEGARLAVAALGQRRALRWLAFSHTGQGRAVCTGLWPRLGCAPTPPLLANLHLRRASIHTPGGSSPGHALPAIISSRASLDLRPQRWSEESAPGQEVALLKLTPGGRLAQ